MDLVLFDPVYEVVSVQLPFYHQGLTDPSIVAKVLEGDRPGRPQGEEGEWCTDDIFIPPQTVASPLTAGWRNGKRSRKGEVSSPPQAVLRHPLEGNANKIGSCPAHHSSVPSPNTPDPQPLGMGVNDPSQLEPGGLRQVSRVNFSANVWF